MASPHHTKLNMYGNLGLGGDWTPMTSWSSNPPTRHPSGSSVPSGAETDTNYHASYASTSRSTSGNWDDAGETHTQKVLSSMDTTTLHHPRALERQATATHATFTASRLDDRPGATKGGQYSPQQYNMCPVVEQAPRFPSVPSPTAPTFPVPTYSSPPHASGPVPPHYNNSQLPSGVNESQQTLPIPRASPQPPPARPYGYVPPPDYNSYQDLQYGYGIPDPAYGSQPITTTPPTVYLNPLNPSIPTPQVNLGNVPVADMYRQQLYYYDSPPPMPPQYYLPVSQTVIYSQPLPPLAHSPLIATQLPIPIPDKKSDSQAATNYLFNSTRSLPRHPRYFDYTQYFAGSGLMPHPHAFLHNVVRGGRRCASNNETVATMRSALLEEFRGNKSRKWELSDIFGHAVEFSGDQHGSRFIQQKLETATSEEKQTIFDEIVPSNAVSLMVDVFGNYVIQKFFEHGTQVQKARLAQTMEGRIHTLSQQMYGCRVVQKAIEFVPPEQQVVFVKELEPHVLACVKDPNGNHVIQKLVERVSPDNLGFIHIFRGNVYGVATHPYGCRVLQRCLEHLPEEKTRPIMDELLKQATSLMQDQFGNYVMQYILEHGKPADRSLVVSKVQGHILVLSKHKFASNVCEKALLCAEPATRRKLIDEILTARPDGVTPITSMMKDQYANYVLQRAMIAAVGEQKEILFNKVTPQLQSMRKHSSAYNKHLAAIERLIEKHAPTSKT